MNEKLRLINKQLELCVKLYIAHDYFQQEAQYEKLMLLCDNNVRVYANALRGFWMRIAAEDGKV